ncbi:MAG TPA: CoA transferase [Bordetella sp.]|nr:CoA transferase [Bordetella sp.]
MTDTNHRAQAQRNDGPLSGVRVIDLTTVGMGPYATQIFGDMGAEVIKVEPPEGDIFRHALPTRSPRMGAPFMNFNRNKRSVCLDIKQAGDRQALLDLVKESDVFISNIRPQALAKLGLDYEALSRLNPRLIYCSAVGFGQAGPYAGKPAFDDIIQAYSGLAAVQGTGNTGGPAYMRTLIADKVTGLTIAYAIPMALYEREKSGLGQAVEVPMFETLVSFTLIEHLSGESYLPAIAGMGYERILARNRKPYRTQDGYISILPYTDAHWARFFKMADRPDLIGNPAFATTTARNRNYDALYGELIDIVATKTTDEWVRLLDEQDIPVARVNTLQDVLDDPHLAAVGFFKSMAHPTEGTVRVTDIPVKMSRTPGALRHPAPPLGADNEALLGRAALEK